jgi:hypothetical protein
MTGKAEWAALIDNPRVLPVLDAIWGHSSRGRVCHEVPVPT